MKRILAVVIGAVLLCVGLLAQGQPSRPGADVYSRLRWRYVGPEGNRTDAVAGVPGDSLVYYAGAASGASGKQRTAAARTGSACSSWTPTPAAPTSDESAARRSPGPAVTVEELARSIGRCDEPR